MDHIFEDDANTFDPRAAASKTKRRRQPGWVEPADALSERAARQTADDAVRRLAAPDASASAFSSRGSSDVGRVQPGSHVEAGQHLTSGSSRIRRRADPDGSSPPSSAAGGPVGPVLEARIQRARRGGTPLEAGQRQQMEAAFGGDRRFDEVKVHAGTEAAELSRSVGAKAFTVGSDVFFRDGLPGQDSGGRQLLAHELAHTLQQTPGTSLGRVAREFDSVPTLASQQPGAFDAVAGGLEADREELHSAAGEWYGESQIHFKNFVGYADELAAKTQNLDKFNDYMGKLIDAGALGAGVLGYFDPNKAEQRNDNGAARSDEDFASKITGAASGALGIVKTGVKQVVMWVDANDLAKSEIPLDDDEKLNLLTGSLQNIAKVAQGVLNQTKVFRELLDQAPTAGVVSAIPGLDIFVNALAIFDAIVKIDQADTARLYAEEQKHEYKERVFQIYDELKAGNRSFTRSTERKSPIKVRGYTVYQRTASAKALAEEILAPASPASKQQRRVAQEYLMYKTGQYVNTKRVTRQTIEIGKAVNNIAASIATLTGVGAAAGASMKTAGAVFGGVQALFRKGKQVVKDKFKVGHTTEQKDAEYKLYIQRLALDMCRAADYSKRLREAQQSGAGARPIAALKKKTDKHFHKVSKTIEGTGMTMTEFSRITSSDVLLGTLFQKLKKSR